MNNSEQGSYGSPKASKLMMRMVIVAGVFLIIVGIVIYRSFAALPFALGVTVTSALNIFKLRMLERTVNKVVHMDDIEAGKNTVRLQYLFRYFLTGIVLVAVALINNYTSPPPIYSERVSYLAVWAAVFPNGPESLLTSPFISIWGALAGIFTMQLSIFIIRFMKLEKDGTEFIKYEDDELSDPDNIDELSETDTIKSNDIKPTAKHDNSTYIDH